MLAKPPQPSAQKAAYAIYYDKNDQAIRRVDFQPARKGVTSAVRSDMARYRTGIRWRNAKARALDRDNYQCCLCGSETGLQVHHIRVDGRPYALENLQTLCMDCHRSEQS
jgi:5-methylcytosine-specific restriction endonuclease McrA